MTNKQIVVDGIDVSECKFYRDEISFVHGEIIRDVCSIWIWQRDYSGLEPSCIMKCHCSDNPNCFYKQFTREKQECEKAKQNAQDTYDLWQALIESFNILQGEKIKLEELKEQTGGLRPELKRLINEICHKYNIKAKTYHEKIVEIIHSLDDYKQVLDDVEDILKQGVKIHDDIIVNKQILQKAREVENG